MYLNEALFSDFLESKEILWLGIDFSKAKFTRKGFDFTPEILRYYFNEWNTLIISDQKKYDIRLSFRKPIMNYDLSLISKKNKSVKLNNLLCENINMSDVFSDEDICEYVKTLASPTQFKYGLLFIVESLDTHSKTGAIWVAIIETNTHTPVLCEKFLKVPSGFGTKNYWGRIFYNLLFDIKSYAFYRWENLVRVNN